MWRVHEELELLVVVPIELGLVLTHPPGQHLLQLVSVEGMGFKNNLELLSLDRILLVTLVLLDDLKDESFIQVFRTIFWYSAVLLK